MRKASNANARQICWCTPLQLVIIGLVFFAFIGLLQWGFSETDQKFGAKHSRKSLERFAEHPRFTGSVFSNPALIVFCYNRPTYLNTTLHSLADVADLHKVTVYVSQDGNDSATEAVARQFVSNELSARARAAAFWQHEREPLLGPDQPGHAWLSQHYKWGLNKVFTEHMHSHAIIVEDDMLLSKDFISYMAALAPLLSVDPSLWCVSSWNDNGLSHLDWKVDRLFRTSYFPGLGWMLRKELWDEIGTSFPLQAWDHWMRLNSTSKGRECIAPEVSRNKNIGALGANMLATTFNRYLAKMAWAQEDPILHWTGLDDLQVDAYEAYMSGLLAQASIWTSRLSVQNLANQAAGQVWLVPYLGENYKKVARVFKIWPFPRGHHHYMTIVPYKGSIFLLADERFCTLLPKSLQKLPTPSLKAVAGGTSLDCNTVCRDLSLECKENDFWFINTCEHLMEHFPCERGCLIEIGPDVPNYVVDRNLSTYQTCLVTQTQPRCLASFPGTQRLCPCIAL